MLEQFNGYYDNGVAESSSVAFESFASWHFMIQLGILFFAILLGNVLVRKIPVFRKFLLPAPLIGGMILLLVRQIILMFATNAYNNGNLELYNQLNGLIDTRIMSLVVFHAVGLGFVTITLKKASSAKKSKENDTMMVMKSAYIMTNVHLIQAIVGVIVTTIFALAGASLIYSAGLLAPIGLAQGTGLASAIGGQFQDPEIGQVFAAGVDFALSIVAIGFFIACIGGVIAQNIYRKKGLIPPKDEEAMKHANIIEMPTKDEIGLTDTSDKFTIQFGIIIFVYIIGYLIMLGLTTLINVEMVTGLIFGLNFVFAVLAAVLFKKVMNKLRQKEIVKNDYTNNFLLNRTSGILFDLMIVAGFALIDFRALTGLWIALFLVCILAGSVTFIYLKITCKKVFGEYHNEALFGLFGKFTGTTGTGLLLLREVDPKLDTPIARVMALQSLPGMVFLFPLILLIPVAMISFLWTMIVMVIVIAMFILFHILIVAGKKDKIQS